MDGPWQLQGEWLWTTLGDVVEIEKQQIDPGNFPDKAVNYLSIENVESDTGRLMNFRPTLGREIRSVKLAFTPQHVLYAKLRPYLNKVHLPQFDGMSATDLIPLRPLDGIAREYVAHYLRTRYVVEYANQRMRGIQLPRLPVEDLKELPFPLAPPAEQRRIVAKIEAISRTVREAREAVAPIPSLLKGMREAVLSRAFEGKLTEQNPSGEPSERLMEEIWAKSRERISLEKRRRQAPVQVRGRSTGAEDLPDLPPGWGWATLRDLGEWIGGGTPSRDTERFWHGGKIPWVSPKDMKSERILDSQDHITELGLRSSAARLVPAGSILMVVRGMILARSFPVAVNDVPVAINQDMKALRPWVPDTAQYLLRFLQSKAILLLFEVKTATHGTKRLESEVLYTLPVPVAPLSEQSRIVSRIESLFSRASAVEIATQGAREGLERLYQAALAKAFRGELVEQDPNDEPAKVLLGRVRAHRGASHSRPKGKTRVLAAGPR